MGDTLVLTPAIEIEVGQHIIIPGERNTHRVQAIAIASGRLEFQCGRFTYWCDPQQRIPVEVLS